MTLRRFIKVKYFKVSHVTIYNHREDAEEAAEDTKPQFL